MKTLSLILAGLLLCAMLAGCNPYSEYITPGDLGITENTAESSGISSAFQQSEHYTRKLLTRNWAAEIFQTRNEHAAYSLSSRRYALSDQTNVYMHRLEGVAPQSVLYHTAFSCGGTIFLYDGASQQWTNARIAPGSYQTLLAYIELDDGQSVFIVLPKTFSRLENGVIEHLPEQDGELRFSAQDGHWVLEVVSAATEQKVFQDCLVQHSPQKLIDIQIDNIATYWTRYADGKEAYWCYDGYYRFVPNEYSPNGQNTYYRCVASYLPRTLSEIPNALASDVSVLIPMMDAIAQMQNDAGYWPTTPLSTWLSNDFDIGAGFYDTRFNTELINLYIRLDSFFGKGMFDDVIDRYVNFYMDMAENNHTQTVNGGWLVEDYWYEKPHRHTHTSLNHQAAECLLLYRLSRHYSYRDNNVSNNATEYQKSIRMQDAANLLLCAIEDTGRQWIMEDNNLYYSRSPDGTYKEGDYPQLTYTDLYLLQEYLAERTASRNEILDTLMKAKRVWMDNNNVSNYLR